MDTKRIIISGIVIIILIVLLGLVYTQLLNSPPENNPSNPPVNEEGIQIVAANLNIPWEIAFLPQGEMLVTERSGTLIRIGTNHEGIPIQGVHHQGEGGLLGLAIHPNYADNHWIYLYFTSQLNGVTENRIERYVLDEVANTLTTKTVILSGIPGSSNHDGGRIEFGPDGMLYITTGDAQQEESAQNTQSLAGKILRIHADGTIPSDNPFGNPVYSYGHRNPQGLAWDEDGQLWATEHGRSGLESGYDELNRIQNGKNYGWPIIQGDQSQEGMEKPIIHSGSNYTWAPAGTAYANGNIFFTGLRGEALYQYSITSHSITRHLEHSYGRLRAVTIEGEYLYVSTSNRDGRGSVKEGDDKIIRIPLNDFS